MRAKLALIGALMSTVAASHADMSSGQFGVVITLNTAAAPAPGLGGSGNLGGTGSPGGSGGSGAAGGSGGQPGGSGGATCVGGVGSSSGGTSVQVRCNNDVFVNIGRLDPLGAPRFKPAFRPARDSLLPEYCRDEQSDLPQQVLSRVTCELEDKSRRGGTPGELDFGGWQIEDQLFALSDDAQDNLQVRRRAARGTVTAMRIGRERGTATIELLVTF